MPRVGICCTPEPGEGLVGPSVEQPHDDRTTTCLRADQKQRGELLALARGGQPSDEHHLGPDETHAVGGGGNLVLRRCDVDAHLDTQMVERLALNVDADTRSRVRLLTKPSSL